MKPIMMLVLCCCMLAACGRQEQPTATVTDGATKPGVAQVSPEASHILYYHNYDNMDRGKHEFAAKEVVVDPGYYGKHGLSRGDIVFYKNPPQKDSRLNLSDYSISRVVALPGEKVSVNQGQVYINGAKLDTFYGSAHRLGSDIAEMKRMAEKEGVPDNMKQNLQASISSFRAISVQERQLSADEVFLAGDDWARSADSILFGPVSVKEITGKVLGYSDPPSVMKDTPQLSREDALREARKVEPGANAKWDAVLKPVELFEVGGHKYARPVWVVTAAYAAGNKTIVRFDAFTGLQISLGEIEAHL